MLRSPQKIFLFANGISMAHPTRMWKLACDLDFLGYQIHFATSENYFKYLLPKNTNITLHHISSISSKSFNDRLYRAKFIFKSDELIRDTKEDSELINKIRPDIIFADFRQTAYISARSHDIPFLNVNQCHWSRGFGKLGILPPIQPVHIFGRSISSLMEPIVAPFVLSSMLKEINSFFCENSIARKAQLHEFKDLSDFYLLGDEVLFADLEDLYPEIDLPQNHHFIGPIIWKNTHSPWPRDWPTDFKGKQVAYVSMGSTGTHTIIPDTLNALRSIGYQVLLSSSGHHYRDVDTSNVYIAPFVPIDKVIQKSNLVICNGGTGTTYHALSYGVPILSIPQNMDQSLHSVRLQKAGVSHMVFSDQVTVKRLVSEIEKLIQNKSTVENTNKFQSKINKIDQKALLKEILKKF